MKKIIITLLTIISIIYFLLVYVIYSFSYSFLGDYGHSFPGRNMPFILLLSGGYILFFVTQLYKKIEKKSLHFSTKIILVSILIFFIIFPSLIFGIYKNLPLDTQNYFFEGIDEKTCETGKKPLPWGRRYSFMEKEFKDDLLSRDLCYSDTGQCEKISDKNATNIRDKCYLSSPKSYLGTSNIKEYSDCDVYTNKELKATCLSKIAGFKKDVEKCNAIDFEFKFEKHYCVAGAVPSSAYEGFYRLFTASSADVAKKICNEYSGLGKDVCLIQFVHNFSNSTKECDQVSDTYPWYKDLCYEL